jgi:hypothetical protein
MTLKIDLKSQTLGDSFSIECANKIAIDRPFGGTLFGWPWGFTIKSLSIRPQSRKWNHSGNYDVSEILTQYINFDRSARLASAVLESLAAQLGKTLVNLTDDHGVKRQSEQTTVMQVLSSLYGWTAQAPSIMTNVFIRGKTMYAVQRGKETSSYSPVKYNIIDASETKLDTLMSVGLWSPQIIGDSTGEYTDGVKEFNGVSIEYDNGYVVRSVDGNGTITTYSWSSDDPDDPDVQKYIVQKTVSTDTFPEVTTYSYATWRGEKYLAVEQTTISGIYTMTVGSATYYFPELVFYQKTINHAPIGSGFYASWGAETTNVYEFSVLGSTPVHTLSSSTSKGIASTISEGRPGGPVTPRELSAEDTTPYIDVDYIPIAPSHIPVTDTATLTRYYDALKDLDEKIEHRMTIDCYDQHIIDFTETVLIDSKTWYLDSNTIIVSTTTKQTASLVRWE